MLRIRTIKTAVAEQKSKDPNCELTENALRQWIKSGQIRCVRSGAKYLIDLDVLEEYLQGKALQQSECNFMWPVRRE